jgi:hypothetical protein
LVGGDSLTFGCRLCDLLLKCALCIRESGTLLEQVSLKLRHPLCAEFVDEGLNLEFIGRLRLATQTRYKAELRK